MQAPTKGTEPGVRRDKRSLPACHTRCNNIDHIRISGTESSSVINFISDKGLDEGPGNYVADICFCLHP